MRVTSVTLLRDQRLAGGLPMKAYHSRGETEVHYEPDLAVVIVTKRDAMGALVVPLTNIDNIELPANMVKLLTDPPPAHPGKKGA